MPYAPQTVRSNQRVPPVGPITLRTRLRGTSCGATTDSYATQRHAGGGSSSTLTALIAGALQPLARLKDLRTSCRRSLRSTLLITHCTCRHPSSHCRPWLENHFLRNFFWRGFDYWYPLVPLFIQATDALFLGKDVAASRSLEEFFSGRPSGTAGPGNAAAAAAAGIDQAGEPMGGSPLRDDVIYVLVVQHDMGALAVVPDPFLWRNTIVLSAGGWGNVPLPLMTGGGCMQQPVYHSPASSDASTADAARAALLRSHLLSFVGRLSYRDVSNHGGISARIMDWRQELMDQLAAALCFAEEAAENSSAAAAAASDADAGAQSAAPAATAPRSIGFTNEELLALGNDAFAASQRPVPPSTAPQLLSPEDMARLRGGSSTISGRDISVRCGLHLQQWRRNDAWKRVTADSALVLATRGVGATSFRLYESLAAGRVPVYVWRDLLWLPYGNAEASLWGPEGIAVVTEGSSAAAALVEGLPQLLRPRSAGELQGRPDAIAAAAAAAGGAAAALDAAAVDASSGSAAPVVASLESIVLQAAARGQAAARDTTKGTPTSQHSSSSVNSAKATSVSTPLAYAIPPSSKLAEMEARLRRLHDRYFSYDALMVHIHAFLKAPHASELQCEPKPTVVYMP